MRTLSLPTVAQASLLIFLIAGCAVETASVDDLNDELGQNTGGNAGTGSASSGASGGSGGGAAAASAGGTVTGGQGGAQNVAGVSGSSTAGASGDVAGGSGDSNLEPAVDDDMGDDDADDTTDDDADDDIDVGDDDTEGGGGATSDDDVPDNNGGTAGSEAVAGAAGDDDMMEPEVVEPIGPYAPRTGPFKMLAYSKTAAFRHAESINTGRQMLTAIASEQGFEVTFTETNEEITVQGLSQYEIVFFLNSTGDIFNPTEEAAYEEWMTMHDGAFAGVHAATDTESAWPFYKEVTGQYYDLHDPCCEALDIQWDPAAIGFVAVQGMPSPWRRSEEWYRFNSAAEWTAKEGFTVLSRITNGSGSRPVSYIREWGNFRSFYTSLGHEAPTFQDANVKKHVAAGIMWAVRREAELK